MNVKLICKYQNFKTKTAVTTAKPQSVRPRSNTPDFSFSRPLLFNPHNKASEHNFHNY